MNFKTHKINNDPPKLPKPQKASSPGRISLKLGIITSLVIIIILFVGIAKAISKIDFTIFLKAAGEDLKSDTYGHTNFLILGAGGKNHDGGDLTDTMMIASLDSENKLVTMVSLPRDTYVKDPDVGNSKLNEVYFNAKKVFGSSTEGLNHLKGKIEEIMGIPIHYYVKVDFKGFKEFIDAIGGIDIDVEKSIYDPYYPKDGTYLYEPFKISAGPHHMDGTVALKYARSRETTSDFDRAKRQQQIIFAIKEQTLQTKILFSAEKISNILETLKSNIETDLTTKEILTLGSLGKGFSKDQITHRLLHDNPVQCGGFLYTPARQFYNGMFVLLPAGGFKFIHMYSDLNFNHPKIAIEKSKIHILNGTKTPGVAGETKQILQRFCFDIIRFGNGNNQDVTQTIYYYKQKYNEKGKEINSRPESLDFLLKLIPGKESTIIPPEYAEYMQNADILIELGTDYVKSENYIEDPFYFLPQLAPATPKVDTPATTTESSAKVSDTRQTLNFDRNVVRNTT